MSFKSENNTIPKIALFLSSFVIGLFLASLNHKNHNYQIPLLLDFDFFTLSIYGLLALGILLLIAIIQNKISKSFFYLASIGPLAFSISSIIYSIERGSYSHGTSNKYILSSFQPDSNTLYIPVFFEINESKLSNKEENKLLDYCNILNNCENDTIIIRGYASSLRFRNDHEKKNLNLANERGKHIYDILDTLLQGNVIFKEWKVYKNMTDSRLVNDTFFDGTIKSSGERLNRRVEIVWKNDCIK